MASQQSFDPTLTAVVSPGVTVGWTSRSVMSHHSMLHLIAFRNCSSWQKTWHRAQFESVTPPASHCSPVLKPNRSDVMSDSLRTKRFQELVKDGAGRHSLCVHSHLLKAFCLSHPLIIHEPLQCYTITKSSAINTEI